MFNTNKKSFTINLFTKYEFKQLRIFLKILMKTDKFEA